MHTSALRLSSYSISYATNSCLVLANALSTWWFTPNDTKSLLLTTPQINVVLFTTCTRSSDNDWLMVGHSNKRKTTLMPKRTKSMGKIWLFFVFFFFWMYLFWSTSSNPIQFCMHIFNEFINNIIAICLMTVIFICFIVDILSRGGRPRCRGCHTKFMIIIPYGRRPLPFELA